MSFTKNPQISDFDPYKDPYYAREIDDGLPVIACAPKERLPVKHYSSTMQIVDHRNLVATGGKGKNDILK
jgi:hypothetical protein